MVVLLTGATGFIGARLSAALVARGHRVVAAVRDAAKGAAIPGAGHVLGDLATDSAADWIPRLAGVEAAINAAGIFRERGAQTFAAVHSRGPIALFEACIGAGVRKVVQISALGADAGARSRFHRSKREADDFLRASPLDWVIVQPSLTYGTNGRSAALFESLASAPLIPLPGDGRQLVQPVHVDDVVEAIVKVLEAPECTREVVALVGPAPLSLREWLAALREAMRLGRARFLPLPRFAIAAAARMGDALPGALLDRETLAMLDRGNVGDPRRMAALLERSPRPAAAFIAPEEARAAAVRAKLRWLTPLLRAAIAAMWLGAGVVSLGLFPVQDSLARLAAVGITSEPWARAALYGAALTDIGMGLATLAVTRHRRVLWLAQIALIAAYTLVITVRLPEFWLEPFGPVLKNLPIVAALWLLYELEDR
jgi:uncharacterized protein YbjT (DUF2867 family)